MIAGLPPESWLLLILSVGLGLGIEVIFFLSQRRARQRPERADGAQGESR